MKTVPYQTDFLYYETDLQFGFYGQKTKRMLGQSKRFISISKCCLTLLFIIYLIRLCKDSKF